MSISINRSSYTGDPGIFGDIGRFIGGAVKSIPVVGGLVGGGIELLANTLDPVRPPKPPVFNPTPLQIPSQPVAGPGGAMTMPSRFYPQQVPVRRTPGARGAVERFLPGGATGYQVAVNGAGAPSGYHLNKSSYYTSEGYVEKGTKWVRNRKRVNPANAKATDRAIGRIKSAKRYAKKLSAITIRETCRKR